jgi:hypothetical protein
VPPRSFPANRHFGGTIEGLQSGRCRSISVPTVAVAANLERDTPGPWDSCVLVRKDARATLRIFHESKHVLSPDYQRQDREIGRPRRAVA